VPHAGPSGRSQFLALMRVRGREGLGLQQLAVGEYICQFNEQAEQGTLTLDHIEPAGSELLVDHECAYGESEEVR
jgi:hypothetical protein